MAGDEVARPLDARDRRVVDEAVEDIVSGPRPTDRGPVGCLLALPGFLVLVVSPLLVRQLGLPAGVGQAALLVGLALLVLGLVLYFTAGSIVRGHYAAAAEAGLRGLEGWDPETGDRREGLRGATLVLYNAVAAHGPTSAASFDYDEGRRRIGTAMPLVEEVERYLLEQRLIYRVFTEDPDGDAEDAETPPPPS